MKSEISFHLNAAWQRRKAYVEGHRIGAFRLATKEELGLPVAVDVYKGYPYAGYVGVGGTADDERTAAGKEGVAVLQLYEDWVDTAELVETLRLEYGLSGFFQKKRYRVKDAPESGGELGEPPVEMVVKEYGHKFLVNLNNYLDTGLFLDHRETRRMVEKMVADFRVMRGTDGPEVKVGKMAENYPVTRRADGSEVKAGEIAMDYPSTPGAEGPQVLNLFAYTGSFSVYAAAGGAVMTHTVDLSKTYCDWVRRNLELNGLPAERNWVYRMDTFEFYRYAARKGMRFDLIIIDPPTFSRNKGENFSVQRDQEKLLFGAAELLKEGGQILFSNNCLDFQLSPAINERFQVKDIQNETIPLDFWIDTQHPHWWEGSNQIHNCYLLTPNWI